MSKAVAYRTGKRNAPASASVTIEFLFARSLAQLVCMFSANHAMFAPHWSSATSVLHVPQMITFISEMFFWLCFDPG